VSSVVLGVILSLTFHNCIQVCRTSIFLTWQHNEACLTIPRPTNLHCFVTFGVLTCVSKHGQTVLYYYYYLHTPTSYTKFSIFVVLSSLYPHAARYFYNVFSESRSADDLVDTAA
jgi:hypothetical protein